MLIQLHHHMKPFLSAKFNFVIFSTFFILLASCTGNNSFQGKVVNVVDGDTIYVLHNGDVEKIRLAQIDCPENDQPYGNAAKEHVIKLASQKNVTVYPLTKDKYGRTVARVILPENKSLNIKLIEDGLAWHYKKYSEDKKLAALEKEVQRKRVGLWQSKNPIPPWEWRKGRRD